MIEPMMRWPRAAVRFGTVASALGLAACATTSLNEAPIFERSERPGVVTPAPSAVPAPVPSAGAAAAAVAREARDGYYVVQRGDTLYSIALAFGQDFRDIARWNALDDPTRLSVGQSLRVAPPAAAAAAVPVAPVGAAEARALPAPGVGEVAPAGGTAAPGGVGPGLPSTPVPPVVPAPGAPSSSAPSSSAPSATAPAAAATAPSAGITPDAAAQGAWLWPVEGKVIETFHETRNKGIDIAGKEGDPVRASADGQVVYSGSGLRGYGNLVILKHSDDYISAYAHNRQILVKQGQAVKRGERIAELGRTDAEVPKLHFEIRRQGKPVDPLQFLPPRP